MDGHALFEGFLHCLGIVAIAAVLYDIVLKRCPNALSKRIATGAVFALGGVGSMMVPVELGPGLVFDMRAVFLILAAPYGGWIVAAVTVVATAACRLWEGGIGVYAGLLGIVLTAAIGCLLAKYVSRPPIPMRGLIVLGLASPLLLVSLFVLPWDLAITLFGQIALPVAIANFIGVVIVGEILNRERARIDIQRKLSHEAATDALTGLATRRVFDREGPVLASKAAAMNRPYSVLVIDVDRFKQINDSHGHAAGDKALQHVAAIIASAVRIGDLVARYGGEEIAVVLPGQDLEQGSRVAERIRRAIAGSPLGLDKKTLQVTASIGVYASGEGDEPFHLAFAKADRALYRAKLSGRNRVVAFQAPRPFLAGSSGARHLRQVATDTGRVAEFAQ